MHRRREMSDQLVVRVVDLLAATTLLATRRAADIELFLFRGERCVTEFVSEDIMKRMEQLDLSSKRRRVLREEEDEDSSLLGSAAM
jgi:hypothetical protein